MLIYYSINNNLGNSRSLIIKSKNGSQNNICVPDDFKILIIDDNEKLLRALSYRLEKRKISVVAIESAFRALKILRKNGFDLVLIDLRMPEMNGSDVFKKIKKMEKKYYVIIMTAFPEDEQMKVVRELKPFGIIYKPFEFDQLLQFIKKRIQEVTSAKRKNINN